MTAHAKWFGRPERSPLAVRLAWGRTPTPQSWPSALGRPLVVVHGNRRLIGVNVAGAWVQLNVVPRGGRP